MFAKLHLLSQDAPESGGGLRWRAHPYLRIAGSMPKGPAVFAWNERQHADLEALWRDAAAREARDRLAHDLAAFCAELDWRPDAAALDAAASHGEEYLVTLSAVPPELYLLPWEVIEVAGGKYLSDYASAQVRYAVPDLPARAILGAPARPGVLFAWSAAGGAVPSDDQAAAIRDAAAAGGVAFRELAHVDEARLQAALGDAAGPPSVLHLLCHGLPGGDGQPPRLRCGASDEPQELTAARLAELLRPHAGAIRLVVLSACGGGDGHGDPLFMTSLAQELHRHGIPDVVASRYPLSVAGSRVMTQGLYDKLLREAWSLERALRHTRATLFAADHPGDAYGIQLYALDREQFVSDNDVVAERPVLASYPFGTAARPVPASGPPRAELRLAMRGGASDEPATTAALRKISEDRELTVDAGGGGGGGGEVTVRTTVDGAQRLLGAWRSKVLQAAVGTTIGGLILTKGVLPALGAPAHVAGVGAGAGASVGAANAGAAASGGSSVAVATQAAATVAKVATAKLAVAAVVGSVAVASGGAAVYHAVSAPAPAVAAHVVANKPSEPPPPPSLPASPPSLPASPPSLPANPPPLPSPPSLPTSPPSLPASPPPSPSPAAPSNAPAPALVSPPAAPLPKGIGDTLFRVDEPPPLSPSSISSIEPGTLTLTMAFTSKSGVPATPIRSGNYIQSGAVKPIAFIVPQQANATGPVLMRNLNTRADSRITISAQSASGSPEKITLRGTRGNGCALLTMNDATLCNNGKDASYYQLWFYDADNPSLPAGTYHGQLMIQAQNYPAATVVESDTINYTITIDRSASPPASTRKSADPAPPRPTIHIEGAAQVGPTTKATGTVQVGSEKATGTVQTKLPQSEVTPPSLPPIGQSPVGQSPGGIPRVVMPPPGGMPPGGMPPGGMPPGGMPPGGMPPGGMPPGGMPPGGMPPGGTRPPGGRR